MSNIRKATRHGLMILGSLCVTGYVHSQSKVLEPLRYSCKTPIFLSTSVNTPQRDGVPATEIKLTTPSSLQQGSLAAGALIPRSRYAVIAEIPEFPKKSMAHAIEICGAESGEYLLTIYEHGQEQYSIAVTADGKDDSISLPENLKSHEGRVRKLKFLLEKEEGKIVLTWLDDNGRSQLHLLNGEW